MRLIDADALKELIDNKMDERFRWDSKLTVCEFKTIVGDIIDNFPTVESGVIDARAVELRHLTEEEKKKFFEAWGKIGVGVFMKDSDADIVTKEEAEAVEEARREAMRLDDNEDTLKWKGTH